MEKPVVHFVGSPIFVKHRAYEPHAETYKEYLDENGYYEVARAYVLDHPILGHEDVRTSIIVKKNEDGSFETLNTMYVQASDEFIKEFNDVYWSFK